jgi:chitinase
MNLGMLHPLMQRLKKHHKKIVDVFIVEYDLAPEYPYPRGLNQCFEAYKQYLGSYRNIIIGNQQPHIAKSSKTISKFILRR